MALAELFRGLKDRGDKALVVFLTAGDQPLADLHPIIETLAEGGADLVEIGIPFSDPYGEGPTIQASSGRSLLNGTTTHKILEAVGRQNPAIPAISMGYTNQALQMGFGPFASALKEAGLQGAILSDLVPDEASDWCSAAAAQRLDTIFLAAPTSTDSRVREVAAKSTGFIYAVTRTGVTGAENSVPADVSAFIERLRAETDRPIAAGFGISSPEHVRMVCSAADGAVVGSSLVKLLHEEWDGGRGRAKICDYVRSLKTAATEAGRVHERR